MSCSIAEESLFRGTAEHPRRPVQLTEQARTIVARIARASRAGPSQRTRQTGISSMSVALSKGGNTNPLKHVNDLSAKGTSQWLRT